MPSPSQSELHVNAPLTNVSIAYKQNAADFIADKVFPKVPVNKQSDLYWKYSKSDFRRTDAKRRAPSTESAGIGWNVTTDSYFAHVYAVHKDIDDQLRANADSNFNLDKDATQFVTHQLLLKRDLDWHTTYFNEGVWGTDLEGKAAPAGGGNLGSGEFIRWDDINSDPIVQFADLQTEFIRETGFRANTLVLGAHAITALKNHPGIIDRIKYTQRGVLTEELVASLLGVERVLVSYATLGSGPRIPDADEQDAATTYDFIADSKSALLLYTPKAPGLMQPAAGYTFTWNGYLGGNAQGLLVKNFRMEHIRSDRIEAEMTYDMKVVGRDLGIFMKSVCA